MLRNNHLLSLFSWITGSEITPLFDEISKCEQRKSLFLQKQNELEAQYQIIFKNDNAINNLDTTNLTSTVSIQNEIEKAKSVLSKTTIFQVEFNK